MNSQDDGDDIDNSGDGHDAIHSSSDGADGDHNKNQNCNYVRPVTMGWQRLPLDYRMSAFCHPWELYCNFYYLRG